MNGTAGSAEALNGLVVDWGGVLTASLDGAMAVWARTDGVDYRHFQDVLRTWVDPAAAGPGATAAPAAVAAEAEPFAVVEEAADTGPAGASPAHLLERGQVSPREFEEALADALTRRGSPVRAEGLLDRMLGGLVQLEDDMVGLVRRARGRGLRTALLSNSWGDHYPAQLWDGLFDAVVISGRVGMRKPEPEIFHHTCDLIGLSPGRCVMVDDLAHNIRGAVAVGMVGVLHRTYAQTAIELEALFALDLR